MARKKSNRQPAKPQPKEQAQPDGQAQPDEQAQPDGQAQPEERPPSEERPDEQAVSGEQTEQEPPLPAGPSRGAAEKLGILRFFKEMGSALAMALIAIVYVIQAFQIPTGSMEDSLLVGDFLLGLKFVYGAPLVPYSRELGVTTRLPAVSKPQRGDVIIFKYPGSDRKDYIKRMVAGPGDLVEFADNEYLFVNGVEMRLPPKGKHTGGGRADRRIANFSTLYIPAKGDTIVPGEMPVREFMFLKNLAHQENPTKSVRMRFSLFLDGEPADNAAFSFISGDRTTMRELQNERYTFRNEAMRRVEVFDFNRFDDWTMLEFFLEVIRRNFPENKVEYGQELLIDNEPVERYVVRFDNYFMVGDNRDNSLDSRYWGYLNWNFVKAKAFILYFSFDNAKPLWRFPMNIRWNRIGKLIREWDGVSEESDKIKY